MSPAWFRAAAATLLSSERFSLDLPGQQWRASHSYLPVAHSLAGPGSDFKWSDPGLARLERPAGDPVCWPVPGLKHRVADRPLGWLRVAVAPSAFQGYPVVGRERAPRALGCDLVVARASESPAAGLRRAATAP